MKNTLLTTALLFSLFATGQVNVQQQQTNLRNRIQNFNSSDSKSNSKANANASIKIERNTALTPEELEYQKQKDYASYIASMENLYFERNKLILLYTNNTEKAKIQLTKAVIAGLLNPLSLIGGGKRRLKKYKAHLFQEINKYNLLLKIELNSIEVKYYEN